MEEQPPKLIYGYDRTPALELDKQYVLDMLVELVAELELDIDLGNLASLAAENGLDPEEFFERLGIAHTWSS